MNLIAKLVTAAIVFLWAIATPGCGGPEFGGVKSKADNELSLGYGKGLRLGAETDTTVKGFQIQSADGRTLTKMDELSLKQSPATTMREGWVPAQQVWNQAQDRYLTSIERQTEMAWNGVNALTEKLTVGGFPVLAQYLEGRNKVAMAKAQRGTLAMQALGAAAGGFAVPPDVLKELDVQLPASQPGAE